MRLIVPMDVPALAEMNRNHLFLVDAMHSQLLKRIIDELISLQHRCHVQKVASIDGHVSSKFLVSADLPSALLTTILDVVDDQACIVD